MPVRIEVTSEGKVTYRPYRLGHYERLRMREQIEDLTIAGIVEDLCLEYASPILIVRKKNGEERICRNYRRLNSIPKKDKYPLPLVDDQLDRLDGKRYFTSLDLKSGYYQMPLEQVSRDKTAFVTLDGRLPIFTFIILDSKWTSSFPEDDKQGAGTSNVYDSDGFYG
ncbi:hypothetical protein QE152_g39647 [Popillia japonica]|uniref:Reverse transcriptase domain-containing protein n=1 Tax=Popillia japonica TaxID=7064 RepID=A0AAW1HTM5_POPJA